METKVYPDRERLYRLPWTINESPIGWVEVTDVCNIHCKGCYRLNKSGHKPLKDVQEEILFLKKWRKCDTITLAGGEAILHPEIREIMKFIHDEGMKCSVITNGVALSKELLTDLRNLGLTGVSFHIDSTQNRPETKGKKDLTELDMNPVRLHYAKMLAEVGGLTSSFGITVTSKNYHQVPLFVQWAIDNIKVVNTLTFITYRGMPITDGLEYYSNGKKIELKPNSLGYAITEKEFDMITVKSQDVYSIIKIHFPAYEAHSYLGGTVDHTSMKWLIGNMILNSKGKQFGAFGNKVMELIQDFYHLKKGQYLVHMKKRKFGKKVFLMAPFDQTVRKAFREFLKYLLPNPLRIFDRIYALNIGVVQAPDFLSDGRTDMCDGCPDMCVHEGKLVNSCRLDECIQYGNYIHFHITDPEVARRLAHQN